MGLLFRENLMIGESPENVADDFFLGSAVRGGDEIRLGFGFDAQTCEFADLMARGIIDPAKVVRSALQGAASIAGLLITTEAMVVEVPGPPPPELPGHHDHEDHLDMEF